MVPPASRRIISACIAVYVLAGLIGIGHALQNPGPPGIAEPVDDPNPPSPDTSPPTDPNTVVLRTRVIGGTWTNQIHVRRPPELTVYGDGRIITTAGFGLNGPDIGVRLWDLRLTRAAYREMYRDAIQAGLGTSQTYDGEMRSLDGLVEIEFLVDGKRRFTTAPAEPGGEADPDGVPVGRAGPLVKRLMRLASMVSDDLVGVRHGYRPDRVAIVARRVTVATQIGRPWPLSRPLTDGDPPSCTILTGREAQEARRLAGSTDGLDRWRSGGVLYMVNFRPLLPDEDCATIVAKE
jgi:hypothetical protein